jgi:hypothetical protein
MSFKQNGGEGGIRTHGTDFSRYNRLAGDPVQPLQHLSAPLWCGSYSTMFPERFETEGEGFEPPSRLLVKRFSRPPPSAARPSLRTSFFRDCYSNIFSPSHSSPLVVLFHALTLVKLCSLSITASLCTFFIFGALFPVFWSLCHSESQELRFSIIT